MIKITRRIANIGVGKYRLPNVLNWLGVKLMYCSSHISNTIASVAGCLISCAVFLNPDKIVFKKNLINLGLRKFKPAFYKILSKKSDRKK